MIWNACPDMEQASFYHPDLDDLLAGVGDQGAVSSAESISMYSRVEEGTYFS